MKLNPTDFSMLSMGTQRASYPIQFKGTAIGDPAIIARPEKQDYKGTGLGDPAIIAKPGPSEPLRVKAAEANLADVYSADARPQTQTLLPQLVSRYA